ncbi:hypothetical protein NCS57_00425900 [Fusarium keratoplasticum]|uniref:Uncharacterized protein n=1 Tax=Fusarium keratoplasticum TaxID=1328300 RepID=A0ACC0R845_9HYPO|nr:hypothetical protein NCS57_00425900 [Fusarium keratoplasticum]KAI8675255.1 hypothetical protein NCS57_00425900 [Fusarium keratoplasticum]
MTSSDSSRRFQIDRGAFSKHYDVKSTSGDASFYVDVSSFTPGKPDLTVHRGASKIGPVVAACHLPKFSGDLKIGLAGPAGPDSMAWEDITRESVLKASEYRWQTAIPDIATSENRILFWKRTHSVGVSGMSPSSLSVRNFKLVDGQTDEILAVFTSDRTLSGCGVLEIRANHGEQFDVSVLISCIGLYEKAKRRSRRSSAGGGGGGGGG